MDPRRRLQDNPFLVLAVSVDATHAELERAAQKLLAELAIGREAALRYDTPVGCVLRSADAVRAALAELRDPERRRAHEQWVRLVTAAAPPAAQKAPAIDWALACELLGVRAASEM